MDENPNSISYGIASYLQSIPSADEGDGRSTAMTSNQEDEFVVYTVSTTHISL
jgi:hypothetical protein